MLAAGEFPATHNRNFTKAPIAPADDYDAHARRAYREARRANALQRRVG
jgi:hypothetical protein